MLAFATTKPTARGLPGPACPRPSTTVFVASPKGRARRPVWCRRRRCRGHTWGWELGTGGWFRVRRGPGGVGLGIGEELTGDFGGDVAAIGDDGGLELAAGECQLCLGFVFGEAGELGHDAARAGDQFGVVAFKSTIKLPYVLPSSTIAPVVSMLRTSLVAVPALRRVNR